MEAEAELRDRLAVVRRALGAIGASRSRTHGLLQPVVADILRRLLPVVDNLKRALETEASVEASESDEFRHFLSGVDHF